MTMNPAQSLQSSSQQTNFLCNTPEPSSDSLTTSSQLELSNNVSLPDTHRAEVKLVLQILSRSYYDSIFGAMFPNLEYHDICLVFK